MKREITQQIINDLLRINNVTYLKYIHYFIKGFIKMMYNMYITWCIQNNLKPCFYKNLKQFMEVLGNE